MISRFIYRLRSSDERMALSSSVLANRDSPTNRTHHSDRHESTKACSDFTRPRCVKAISYQFLATDFDYLDTIKNMITCCIETGDHQRAHKLQEQADTCTAIDIDIIGPIQLRFQ